MMSNLPIRIKHLTLATVLAAGLASAAPADEHSLTLDEELRERPESAEALVRSGLADEVGENEIPLTMSFAVPPSSVAPPAIPAPAQSAGPAPAATAEAAPPPISAVQAVLSGVWLLAAILLCLHLGREWLRVMRVRVRRPPRSVALEHAPWPAVSILIPARGGAMAQARRLDALQSCFFDYPVDRIHFVPMFDSSNPVVTAAVARLSLAFPEHVHPLPMLRKFSSTLAEAMHTANIASIGTALVVLDQETPLPQAWLRQSVTPLLDPAVGTVLARVIPPQTEGTLSARLGRLSDHAETLIATQSDALSLLLCGKARIRALRRQAVKDLESPDLQQAPDGASIVQEMTRLGWQSRLLGDIQICGEEDAPDVILSPRLRLSIAWRSMHMASIMLNPNIPAGARVQAGSAFFSAALPLIWLASLFCGIALYLAGCPLIAGFAVALCAATAFDPYGQPGAAFGIAAAARMAGLRTEIRLLPLTFFSFVDRLIDGLFTLLRARLDIPNTTAVRPPETKLALEPDKGGTA